MKKLVFLLLLFSSLSLNAQNDYIIETADISSQVIPKTEEEIFVEKNFRTIPMCQWDETTKFMFERSYLNDKEASIPTIGFKYKSSINKEYIADKILYVSKIYEKKGRTYVEFKCEDNIFTYEYVGSKEELCANSGKVFTYISLVYLGDIDIARKILIGKELYTTKNTIAYNSKTGRIVGKQYDKVHITRVGTSLNKDAPVRLFFEDKQSIEYYVDVYISNTNKYTDSGIIIDSKYFPYVFSLSDIRLKYPEVSDENWECIQNREVKIGMSKTECILSIGNPSSRNSDVANKGVVSEQWVYDKLGLYIYFKEEKINYMQDRN